MQGMKGLFVLSVVFASLVVGACRREAEHTPMKLGADVPAAEHVAR